MYINTLLTHGRVCRKADTKQIKSCQCNYIFIVFISAACFNHLQAKTQVHQLCPEFVFKVVLGDNTKSAVLDWLNGSFERTNERMKQTYKARRNQGKVGKERNAGKG
jgi:hypothetical protein